MNADEGTQKRLSQLRTLGVRIAMDDFGTGYSSLTLLRQSKVDRLKIDRSFVAEAVPGGPDEIIIGALTTMARGLGIETLAEGVETVAQRDLIAACGCRQMQGFLFAKPMECHELEALLADEDLLWAAAAVRPS